MNKFRHLAAISLVTACTSHAAVIFSSDVDDDGSWVGNSGYSETNFNGLLNPYPQAGLGAFVVNGGQFRTADTGQTVQAGTYIYTATIGNWSNLGFHDQPVAFNIRAGGTNFSLDPYQTTAITPPPASGAWETWTVTYDIPETAAEIGQPIVAVYWAQGSNGQTNSAFDGPLTLDFTPIPEPSSSLLGLMALTLLGRRRR